ncbi:carbon starvation protein CstA [Dermacoccus sp. PE3]|uniref:carbon starvation CstA family protein n=1 Tax=Dermacoccus sp. PE3 TaxID=1641401 RepID=UPI000641B40B|nr:carbon starvation CstA family protein [Dermacoccus sp. PE3]KLO63768.1 carbon starvation protein CstA [Dermacoccus sp. PE3]
MPASSTKTPERDGNTPPVAVDLPRQITGRQKIVIAVAAVIAAIGWTMVAFVRGEHVNSIWFVMAAVGSYVIGYMLYSRLIQYKVIRPRDDLATPAEQFENGQDFMPTDRRVLFGHHFAAIAGAGPLVGPVLAAQMGYLPGTLWIIFGVIFAGAVQDYMVLAISTRRGGRSLGQMARDTLGPVGGWAAMFAVMAIMIILIAVLGLVVVNALAESPWGVFSLAMTIPIALFMGCYLRFVRPGAVSEVSGIGVVLLLLAIVAGGWVAGTDWGKDMFTLSPTALSWAIIIYGFAAAVLPVWLLLAPRDYLSTFMKVGTIVLLALGIVIARPSIDIPAITSFGKEGNGPVFAGSLFPFLFITIACGALSGFHALISSGTTPKLLQKESQARLIGYGSMLVESFVAIMALIAAAIIDHHLYFVMNSPAGVTGGTPEKAAAWVNSLGLGGDPTSATEIAQAAKDVGEESVVSRTGGAPTFAFGMSNVFSQVIPGASMKQFWYHFAIMFEALFILTTVDAGTRVARFMLSDTLSNVPGLKRFRETSWKVGAWITTFLVVAGWGSILLMGVTDPLGGINTLFPLFGIANQLLAAVALTVVVVVVVKSGHVKWAWIPGVPLAWDVIVTMTASYQKIFSSDPKLGYWAQHKAFVDAKEKGLTSFKTAKTPEAIDAVIRNTFIQQSLSILFAGLVLIVVIAGVIAAIKAVRAGEADDGVTDEKVPSKIFAPAGFSATDDEKAVLEQWREAGLDPEGAPAGGRVHA